MSNTPEQQDRLREFLDLMTRVHSSDEQVARVKELIASEGIEFIEPSEENAPSLDRKLETKRVGMGMMELSLTNVDEDIVRNEPEHIEFMVRDAIESLIRKVFKDDLYRANGLNS